MSLLQFRILNGWPLFFLIAALTFVAFATSPLLQLSPGSVSQWLSRNRRYTCLTFAAGFGWQAVFIAVLMAMYPSYYWEELHVASDLLGRVASYILLIALTVTSFFP